MESLRANTVTHGSQLPFRYWLVTIHLFTSTKKSFSAAEIQRRLGQPYYQPIWTMVHKLRSVMGKRDELYELSGCIELRVSCIKQSSIEGSIVSISSLGYPRNAKYCFKSSFESLSLTVI